MVHQIYRIASPLPQFDCIFFLLTIRARNVFQNGLFNDPLQSLFSYIGVLLLLRRQFVASLTFFSLGASVKMSGLLWAPGAAAYLLPTCGLMKTIKASWLGVLLQLLVAFPFRAHLWHYIHQSFELDRTFTWFNVCKKGLSCLPIDRELEISGPRYILLSLILYPPSMFTHPFSSLFCPPHPRAPHILRPPLSPLNNSLLWNRVFPLPTLQLLHLVFPFTSLLV